MSKEELTSQMVTSQILEQLFEKITLLDDRVRNLESEIELLGGIKEEREKGKSQRSYSNDQPQITREA